MKSFTLVSTLIAGCLAFASAAHGQIKVGVIVSATGPAAAIGQPQQRMAQLLPSRIAGQDVAYIVVDDASDSNQAARAARRLTTEEKVDVILGPSVNASAFPVLEIAAETMTPLVVMAPGSGLTSPIDAKRRWVFKGVMDERIMAEATLKTMATKGIKTIAVIASSESYGESWIAALPGYSDRNGIKIVATERFGLTDVAAAGQTIRLLSAKPDAILVVGISTTAAMPHKALRERGYKGPVYQTYGSLNNEFLKVGGKDVEGAISAASSKFLVLDQLGKEDPVKERMGTIVKAYEEKFGPGSAVSYIMNLKDAQQIAASGIEGAMKSGSKPGTVEFRQALRNSIEKLNGVQLAQSRISFTPENHTNLDVASVTLFTIEAGKWVLLKP